MRECLEKILTGLLLLPLLTLGVNFFEPDSDLGTDLPEHELYPRGRVFPFTVFAPDDLQQLTSQHFPLAGPVYTKKQRENLFQKAGDANLQIIYPLFPEFSEHRLSKSLLDLAGFDPAPYMESLRNQVKEAGTDRRVAWWYLTPEELRPWRKNDMNFLDAALKTIREADPLKRPVWLYLPNHYDAEQLKPFASMLDILGKGMYPSQLGKEHQRVWCRWSTENQQKAIRESNGKAIPIAVTEMFRQPPQELRGKVETLVRHDTYLALLHGARGIAVFSFAKRKNFEAWEDYYQANVRLARELVKDGLGEAFLFGRRFQTLKIKGECSPEILTVSPGKDPNKDAQHYPALSSLELGYQGERLLFLINSSNTRESAVTVEGLPKQKLLVIDRFSGTQVCTVRNGKFSVTLKPYEVKCFRFVAF